MVTVLFADLARFTGWAEVLDPESVKNWVDRAFAALAEDITGHGGRVDKVVGDAIIALFGAPLAHEDDAERAVRAGLQMQRTISGFTDELGARLELRVGINTGEVLVGSLRAGGDYTAMGDVVNVASRLQTAAAPGSVVVGASTHALTESVVRYEELGLQVPRGREEPIAVWRAVESLVPPGHRLRRSSTPLVGRHDEMALLRGATATAFLHRRPSLAVIVGDAGIGKTRLTEELSRWADKEHGALVLEGRCVPYGEANPWWPVAEMVRSLCGIDSIDDAEETQEKCLATVTEMMPAGADPVTVTAGLLHLLGDEDALAEVDPQRARQEARRAVQALIGGVCRTRPLLMILSELHWAEEVVLDLVDALMERSSGLPLGLVVTARPELTSLWTPPVGRHNQVLLNLDPLDSPATRQLAAALLAEHGLEQPGEDTPVVDSLAGRSGGNPLFLEELIALTTSADAGEVELPATLRGIVAARLDSLPAAERSVLEDAAVVGRRGTLKSLTALAAARGNEDVERLVRELASTDLLDVDGSAWEFRSEVVREVVYEILTKSERARRHWTLASWVSRIAAQADREDEYLEQVAHHYAAAAELSADVGPVEHLPPDAGQLAVSALRRAAAWAMGRELLSSASRLLDRAAALSEQDPALQRLVMVDRAQVRIQIRDLSGARHDIESVLKSGDDDLVAIGLTLQGYLEQAAGDLEQSSATLSRALAEWRRRGDAEGEAYALRGAGTTSFLSGDMVRAEEQLDRALELARRLGRRRDEAWTLWNLSWAAFSAGRIELAEDRLRAASESFRAAGDVGGQSWVRGLLGFIRMVQGRRAEAEALALPLIEEARDRGDRWSLGMVLVLAGSLRLWQGRVNSAIDFAEEACRVFGAIKDSSGLSQALGILARALAAAGRVQEAHRTATQMSTLAVQARGGMEAVQQPLVATLVALHAGDWRTASAEVDRLPQTALSQIEVAAARGLTLLQADRAEEAYQMLRSAEGTVSGKGEAPNLLANLALAAAATGRAAEADEAVGRALGADPAGTYRDQVLAKLARAFALSQQGRPEEAESSLGDAIAQTGQTEDRLTWALVRLAGGRLRESTGDPAGAEQALAALTDLGDMDCAFDGWDRVFRRCATAVLRVS